MLSTGIVMLGGATRSTRCRNVTLTPFQPLATPTNTVDKVRTYRRARNRWLRRYRPCPPKGEGALSFNLAL